MLKIYRKLEKNMDNLTGVLKIDEISFLDRPFLLCLSAQDRIDRSVFGVIKMGACAARVNTIDDVGAGYKINEFPVDFLGMQYIRDNDKDKPQEMVEQLLYPFLIAKGKDVYHMIKQARRVNLFTYCDGTLSYKEAEKVLEERLKREGFNDEDINEILSQVSLVAIGTMVDTSMMKSHTTTFIDVNDGEIFTGRTEYYQKLLQEKDVKSLHGTLGSEKHVLYIYDGSGRHSLKEYFKDDNIVKLAISSVLASYLQNSVQNEKIDDLCLIDSNDVLKGLDKHETLKDLDNSLNYDAPKYTLEEVKMRHELDISYKEILKTRSKLEREEKEKNHKLDTINSLVDKIRDFSSETTFYQILVSSGLWQQSLDGDVFSETSDKEIRKLYEELVNKDEQANQYLK